MWSRYVAIVLLLWFSTGAVFAQETGDGTGDEGGYMGAEGNYRPETPSPVGTGYPGLAALGGPASAKGTTLIVNAINQATQFCRVLKPAEYSVDCLAYELWSISRAMPSGGEYNDARKAIADAAGKMQALARANASPVLKPARSRGRGAGKRASSRPLVPVDKRKLDSVARQAEAIIAETQTVLLRSAEKSASRQLHYQQISAALGSTKVLLRSL